MSCKKICLITIIVCIVSVAIIGTYLIINHKPRTIDNEKGFKELYELYNNITLEDKTELIELSIPDDNRVEIKTESEILDVLNNETALIYFGYPQSQLDRRMINILINTIKEKEVSKIYYVDIFNIRDEYKSTNNGKPSQTKKGTESYKKIVEFLSDYLHNYMVSGGLVFYDTGIKRLNAPTIVFVSDGQVFDFHEGLIEDYTNHSEPLTEIQEQKLKKVYESIIDKYISTLKSCDLSKNGAC